MRVFKIGVALGLALVTASCAMTQEELTQEPPNARFVVAADLSCLYEKGAEKAASSLGMTEPKMSSYINASAGYAWFRQPLTLIRLRGMGGRSTEITRQQYGTAAALGQGSDMLAYLKANPCASDSQ
jgi:hypothetical protein